MKKVSMRLLKLWKKLWVKIVFYLICIIFVIMLYGLLADSEEDFWNTIISLFKEKISVIVFLSALLSLVMSAIMRKIESLQEDDLKIENDHLKIITQYSGHKNNDSSISLDENYYDSQGSFMEVHNVDEKFKKIKNPIKDRFSKEYDDYQFFVDSYFSKESRIFLPSLNMYTNVNGKCKLSFNDCNKHFSLNPFLLNNSLKLFEAHKYSNKTNNVTMRLDSLKVLEDKQKIILNTSRTSYYDMLITNRCMDYQINDSVSLRKLYEYNKFISDFENSQLSNQIGINGMIISSDGYLLLEKRGVTKSTWKGKFAQPISLAFKYKDVKKAIVDECIDSNELSAEKVLNSIIFQTIKDNYGLNEGDFDQTDLQDTFLGLARDLLEGGKPNIYFVYISKYDHLKLKQELDKRAAYCPKRVKGKTIPKEQYPISKDKLKSDYYLVSYDKLKVNFNYELNLKKKEIFKINRKSSPRYSFIAGALNRFKYNYNKPFGHVKAGCGEALLVCLSFMELCKKRIKEMGEEITKKKGV